VLIQPGLKNLFQTKALVTPLLVEGTKVKPAILFVIRPRAVVYKDPPDIMQGVCQIEKQMRIEGLVVGTASEKQENLIEQIRIGSQNGIRWMSDGVHGFV
jgi:hypothetical protein